MVVVDKEVVVTTVVVVVGTVVVVTNGGAQKTHGGVNGTVVLVVEDDVVGGTVVEVVEVVEDDVVGGGGLQLTPTGPVWPQINDPPGLAVTPSSSGDAVPLKLFTTSICQHADGSSAVALKDALTGLGTNWTAGPKKY